MTILRTLAAMILAMSMSGCASMVSHRMAGNIKTAMLGQDDPQTVKAAAPAFLLLVESMIAENPDDSDLLAAGAEMSLSYASLLDDPERQRRLTERSFHYATQALCVESRSLCETRSATYEEFAAAVDRVGTADLDILYVFAIAWAGWMEFHADDWEAIADLPKLEYIFERILAMDPSFRNGRAQLYAGALAALRPPSLGGNPDQARGHFEAALSQTERRDLMVQVEYARRYARQVYDQDLHDRLLNEVLTAETEAPGLTLTNILAQDKAARLLAEQHFSQ